MDKKQSRLRRARQTRAKIAELKVNRLAVHRTNLHIYASIIGPDSKVLASASTLEAEVRQQLAGQSGARAGHALTPAPEPGCRHRAGPHARGTYVQDRSQADRNEGSSSRGRSAAVVVGGGSYLPFGAQLIVDGSGLP